MENYKTIMSRNIAKNMLESMPEEGISFKN